MTEDLNMKSTQAYELWLPPSTRLFLSEVGLICTAADGVSTTPSVTFGAVGSNELYLAATDATGITAVHARHRFTTLATAAGTAVPRFAVTTAATGTTLTARAYWRGFVVRDPA
jgi:hypothetical protein